jgi:putative ABC transport system permease protein
MLKSYFIMAWRNLTRNRVSSIVNIGGLMLGLTTGIIILLYILHDLGIDGFHKNGKDIYAVMINKDMHTYINTGRSTPGPLGPLMHSSIPELAYVSREAHSPALVRNGDKTLNQEIVYVDPDFLRMMTYPALEGNPVSALEDIGSVVVTESTARRIFGTTEVLGKTLLLDNTHPLKVGAVIRDIPENSSDQFDMLASISLYARDNIGWFNRWDNNRLRTWIQLRPGADTSRVNKAMTRIMVANQDEKNIAMFGYPLRKLTLYDRFDNGKASGGKIYFLLIFGALAAFVLLIACINFMNLATAMAEHRAREVGIRKVMGASRRLIIIQFLGEAVLLAMVALSLSAALTYLVLPAFTSFADHPLAQGLQDPRVWLLLIALGLLTGLIAGSYPALYLSGFRPAKVLKRMVSMGRRGSGMRKGLVTFQFVISIFLIIGVIVTIRQIDYVTGRPIGYEPSNLVDISADGDLAGKFNLFKSQVGNIPGVLDITACNDNMVRFGAAMNGLEWPGKKADQDFYIQVTSVQYEWARTTGLTILEGRDFSPAFGSDTSACLVNQEAVRRMGLKEPLVGTRLGGNTLIGVFNDFVFNDPANKANPLIVYLNKGNISNFLVRLNNDGQWRQHLDAIGKVAKALNPAYPFTFRFTNDAYEDQSVHAYEIRRLVNIFGGLAILISCMGLFGLSGFLAERRKKEISIRKVLGARPATLWFLLSRSFLQPVGIAFIVATPLAAWACQKLLNSMEYHIQLSWWIFVLAGVSCLIIALATVSYHGLRTALVNPARSLQTE